MASPVQPPDINKPRKRFGRRRKRQDGEPSAMELIEEGVHLLRQTSIAGWALYVSGIAPFVLGFLYFWTEMASSGLANQVLIPGALVLALLFFWMKVAQARFAKGLREALTDEPEGTWSFSQWMKVLRRQLFWQSTGLIVIPIAFIVTLPFAWVSAFYQTLAIADPRDGTPEDDWVRETWRLSRIWHEQNWILLSLLGCVFFLSFLNILTVVGLVPYLLKALLGIETVFSRVGIHLFNSTTLFACLLLAYVATDPLVKAVYLLRLHYCASRQTGADMLLRLRRATLGVTRAKGGVALLVLALLHFIPNGGGLYGQGEESAMGQESTQVENLDASIEEVLQKREFVWRFPRDEIEDEFAEPAWLESLINTFKAWQENIENWFEKWFRSDRQSDTEDRLGGGWQGFPGLGSFLSYLIIALFVLVVIYFAIRAWKMYQPLDAVEGTSVEEAAVVPDLNEEDVAADLLPRNRWVELARELITQGELRLALRAYFLAQLSALASEGLIIVRRSKSNRDYGREIARRAHGNEGLLAVYHKEVRLFESIWYGQRPTGQEEISEMESLLIQTGVLS